MRGLKLRRLGLALTMAIVGVILFSTFSHAADFSADMVKTTGKTVTTGKIFIKGDKVREETVEKGQNVITILRLDKKVVWNLMADNKYMEFEMPFDPAKSTEVPKGFEYDRAVLGTGVVNGFECEVVQYTYKNMSYGILTQWVARSLQYVIKSEMKTSKGKVQTTIEYQNIKEEPLDDLLFEIPPGYEKFNLPFNIKLPFGNK